MTACSQLAQPQLSSRRTSTSIIGSPRATSRCATSRAGAEESQDRELPALLPLPQLSMSAVVGHQSGAPSPPLTCRDSGLTLAERTSLRAAFGVWASGLGLVRVFAAWAAATAAVRRRQGAPSSLQRSASAGMLPRWEAPSASVGRHSSATPQCDTICMRRECTEPSSAPSWEALNHQARDPADAGCPVS